MSLWLTTRTAPKFSLQSLLKAQLDVWTKVLATQPSLLIATHVCVMAWEILM